MGIGLDIAYGGFAAVSSPVWGYRLLRTGKWRTDWSGRFGRCEAVEHDRPTVLVHAVSVGEVNAVRLFVKQLNERTDGRWRIVVSTTTDTGFARARQLFEPAHRVVRYPLDFSGAVVRFLEGVKPDVVALVELEVWPNFVGACERRGVRVCVINGRLSARSFGRYRLARGLLRKTFGRLAAAAVQTKEYAERFEYLGVPGERVSVTDTMKWDTAQVAEAGSVAGVAELARAVGIDRSKPVVVAGSTAPGEERMLIETCPAGAQLVIAPRKPEWFEEAARIVPGVVRRTEHPDGTARAMDGQRVFLLDTIGELRKAYALADVVVVGRSFGGLYGSDPIEAVALGRATVIGPRHSDFADIVGAFVAGDGIVVTDKPGEAVGRLLGDRAAAARLAENGRRVILSRQGATDRHVELVMKLMEKRSGQ